MRLNAICSILNKLIAIAYPTTPTGVTAGVEIQAGTLILKQLDPILPIVKFSYLFVFICFTSPVHQVWLNHLAKHSERGKKTRQTEDEVGRQHQGMDRPGVRQVPEGSGEQEEMEKAGCKIICGAPTTLSVKGLMMMMK